MIKFLKGCVELLAVIFVVYISLAGLTILVTILTNLGYFSFVIAIFIILLLMAFLYKQLDY